MYLRAADTNDNSRRVVGVQRENFYSAVAGEMYTGTIIDNATASEFGKVSGFSASVGVVFKDVSQFVEDPTAFVDGMQALLDLVTDQGLDVVDTLIDSYISQFEQKQARNNPYGSLEEKEHEDLYNTFERNWYKGYAAGFLSKMVLSGGAGKTAKSAVKQSDRAGDIADRLSDTRALKALSRMDSTKEAGKARVTARILLASDDASEAVLSQADTAGQAVRLWRLQRGMDADVDALPEAKQERLGRTLAAADSDSRSAIRGMDRDALDDLSALDVGPRTRAALAPKYAELDATERQRVSSYIDGDDEKARLISELDSDTTRDLLPAGCAVPTVSGPGGLTDQRAYSVERPALAAQQGCPAFRLLDEAVESDVSGQKLSRLLDPLDSNQRDRLKNAVLESETPGRFLEDVSPGTVQRIADGGGTDSFRQAVELYDQGVSTRTTGALAEHNALQTALDLEVDSAADLRRSLSDAYDSGWATSEELAEFVTKTKRLEGLDGLESGPVKQVRNARSSSDFQGAYREVTVADDIGAENIDRMNLELPDSSQYNGELDIRLESGEVVEVKSTFGADPRTTFGQFEKKLRTMREHPDTDLDGNTLTIRAGQVDDPADVQEKLDHWEQTVAESDQWNNADVDIRVVDDAAGEVVAD